MYLKTVFRNFVTILEYKIWDRRALIRKHWVEEFSHESAHMEDLILEDQLADSCVVPVHMCGLYRYALLSLAGFCIVGTSEGIRPFVLKHGNGKNVQIKNNHQQSPNEHVKWCTQSVFHLGFIEYNSYDTWLSQEKLVCKFKVYCMLISRKLIESGTQS